MREFSDNKSSIKKTHKPSVLNRLITQLLAEHIQLLLSGDNDITTID